MKKLLIISHAFPPIGIVGSLRPFKFCRYLPEFGWQPTVVTIRERPDLPKDNSLLRRLPGSIMVYRTSTFDPLLMTRRIQRSRRNAASTNSPSSKSILPHANSTLRAKLRSYIKRCALALVSTPDHQIFWVPFAISKTLHLLLRENFQIIYTTSPPHSTHLAGLLLSRLLGRPWVVDFRDPWTTSNFPRHPVNEKAGRAKKLEQLLERMIVKNASSVISSSEGYHLDLVQKYSELPQKRFQVITNGFEQENLRGIVPYGFKKFTVSHIGVFYPRFNPYVFLEGLTRWLEVKRDADNCARRIQTQVLLVGSGDPTTKSMVAKYHLQDIVHFTRRLPHKTAVRIGVSSDLLLLAMGSGDEIRSWIPAKLFEYLGYCKPILAIVPPGGSVEKILEETGAAFIVRPDDPEGVADIIERAYQSRFSQNDGLELRPNRSVINRFEQRNVTKEFAHILDGVIDGKDSDQ